MHLHTSRTIWACVPNPPEDTLGDSSLERSEHRDHVEGEEVQEPSDLRAIISDIHGNLEAFESVLAEQLQGWSDELIMMAGMIGSLNGWHERRKTLQTRDTVALHFAERGK